MRLRAVLRQRGQAARLRVRLCNLSWNSIRNSANIYTKSPCRRALPFAKLVCDGCGRRIPGSGHILSLAAVLTPQRWARRQEGQAIFSSVYERRAPLFTAAAECVSHPGYGAGSGSRLARQSRREVYRLHLRGRRAFVGDTERRRAPAVRSVPGYGRAGAADGAQSTADVRGQRRIRPSQLRRRRRACAAKRVWERRRGAARPRAVVAAAGCGRKGLQLPPRSAAGYALRCRPSADRPRSCERLCGTSHRRHHI